MAKAFLLQNKYILGLGNWLGSLSLPGRQSRARTKFIDMLEVALKNFEKDRMDILMTYSEKDEKGSPKMQEEDGKSHYVIPDDKLEEFNAEMKNLQNEDAVLSGTETLPTLYVIRNLVLEYPGTIEPSIAKEYEYWCQAFEAFE